MSHKSIQEVQGHLVDRSVGAGEDALLPNI
jgi:hypothetical protein